MITKQQEIEILEKAIKSLGPDSYLGPWLTQIKAGLADLIKTDMFPDITLNDAIRSGEEIKKQAFVSADDILREATLKAVKIELAADRHKYEIGTKIKEALAALERW